jgi:hypothetical protein
MAAPRSSLAALALYAYTSGTSGSAPLLVAELGDQVEGLEFTTVSPGGFGDLACVLKLREPRLPRPELGLFARVCLRDGLFTCFGGEWSDPALVLDAHGGEYVLLSALGGGTALRDDPDDSAYTTQTAQAILAAEFAKRSGYLAVDPDLSAVLPAAPSATFSPVYDGYTLEEICHDLAFALGDYAWTVYDHPTKRDAAGFPTWQLQMGPRDTATTHYLALAEDVLSWRITPSQQRAYNVVQVCYVDVSGGPATVTVSDPRLAVGGGQGTAPFRRRKLRRSLGKVPLTTAQATAIANAWLTAYEDVTNKVEVVLRGVRAPNGQPLPLHQVRADRNLFVPELAVRGQRLSSGPVPGTNQFYIVETLYRETGSGDVTLRLQLDNYADAAGAEIARLKLAYDAASRRRGEYRYPVSPGVLVVGGCGATLPNSTAGATCSVWVPFPGVLSQVPSSVTVSVTGSSNATSIGASGATKYGFSLHWTSPAAGATSVIGTYSAQG